MDAKSKEKAVFRSKLREATRVREKRVDSPLVRYNEYDQPVCRVCNIALKSDSLWPAHQVSRKHHEAVEKVRASAAGLHNDNDRGLNPAADFPHTRMTSVLPTDFFDKQEPKRQKSDVIAAKSNTPGKSDFHDYRSSSGEVSITEFSSEGPAELVIGAVEKHDTHFMEVQGKNESEPSRLVVELSKMSERPEIKNLKAVHLENFEGVFASRNEKDSQAPYEVDQLHENANYSEGSHGQEASLFGIHGINEQINIFQSNLPNLTSRRPDGVQVPQVRGALPEGFFDNKDADLRARGIEPVKVDMVDAYKEFEKEIEEHLQEVDARLEEDEIDAAVVSLEEFEALEQNEKREQADVMKKKVMEMKVRRLSKSAESLKAGKEESSGVSSGSDGDEEDDDFAAVDWRAQHL